MPLVVSTVFALPTGVFAAAAIGTSMGWTEFPSDKPPYAAAIMGIIPVALGSLAGLALLVPASARTVAALGPRVLAASAARMIIALLVGTLLFFTNEPQPYIFFAALTISFFLILITETAWATAALKRNAASIPSPLHTESSTGASAR